MSREDDRRIMSEGPRTLDDVRWVKDAYLQQVVQLLSETDPYRFGDIRTGLRKLEELLPLCVAVVRIEQRKALLEFKSMVVRKSDPFWPGGGG